MKKSKCPPAQGWGGGWGGGRVTREGNFEENEKKVTTPAKTRNRSCLKTIENTTRKNSQEGFGKKIKGQWEKNT